MGFVIPAGILSSRLLAEGLRPRHKATASLKSLRLRPCLTHSSWLLHTLYHRTGQRSQIAPAPLYRLHIALAFPSSLL